MARRDVRRSVIVEMLSAVFPVFNEADNVGPLLTEALDTLGRFADGFEIVIVDDGSTDNTADIVRSAAERDARVRLVAHPTNLGYGHALRSGLAHSRGDAVAWIDGDRQFRVADLSLLFGRFGNADIVAGRRIKRADPWHRLAIARVYKLVLRATFGLRVGDVDCGFKLYRREVVDAIIPQLESRSAFVSPEILIRARAEGYRIVEVGVPHHPRVAGRPKGATPTVIARTLGEIARLRRSLGPGRDETSSGGS